MTTKMARTFGRYIALPVLSAGMIGGAALGMAGMANAAPSTNSPGASHIEAPHSNGNMFAPHTKAHPAPNMLPGWHLNHGAWRAERLEPSYHR